MPDSYKDYLAANVLSEGKIVNYRMLSRALGIHVNLAKQYLYEFYQTQRARKHDSVHATYLLSGCRRYEEKSKPLQVNGQVNGGHGNVPASSPFPSSAPREEDEKPELDLTAISIVKEEDLEETEAKAKLSEVTAIHIYSLERATFRNLQTLSDCNREISLTAAQNDENANVQHVGIIYNPLVKKRKTKCSHIGRDTPTSQILESKAKSEQIASESTSSNNVPSKTVVEKPFTSRGPSSQTKKGTSSHKSNSKVPALNRDNSDLFKSFAKAKTKPKTEQPSVSGLSSAANDSTEQSASEDEPMEDAFEAEQDLSASENESTLDVSEEGKAMRQSKLHKMMEDEDEPMKDEEEMEEEQAPANSNEDTKLSDDKHDTQAQVTVAGGRRRGRRRIMKKRTLKDEEGYLVTKEEPMWESFSEEEPERKTVSSISSTQNSKKNGDKPGQGKIMSFFSKK